MRRTEIEGVVTDLSQGTRNGRGRGAWRYFIQVNGRGYETTLDLFELAERGQRIRAEVGKGSGMILWFETRPF